jgi:hypothetical protein
MLMAPFHVCKMVEIHHPNIYIYSKKLAQFIVISKIELKNFQKHFILEFFLCLKLESLKSLLKIYSLRASYFFQKTNLKFLAIVLLFIFSFEFALFFHFFPNKNC